MKRVRAPKCKLYEEVCDILLCFMVKLHIFNAKFEVYVLKPEYMYMYLQTIYRPLRMLIAQRTTPQIPRTKTVQKHSFVLSHS